MTETAGDLKFSSDHAWIVETDRESVVRIGISDFAQAALGEIVYVFLPAIDSKVVARSPFGDIESTKVVSDLVAPVTGTVVSRNDSVLTDPSLINSDPHGSGWLLEVSVTSDDDFGLLDVEAYRALTRESEIE